MKFGYDLSVENHLLEQTGKSMWGTSSTAEGVKFGWRSGCFSESFKFSIGTRFQRTQHYEASRKESNAGWHGTDSSFWRKTKNSLWLSACYIPSTGDGMDLNAFACELNFIGTIEVSLTFSSDCAGNWGHLFNGIYSASTHLLGLWVGEIGPGIDRKLTGEVSACSVHSCLGFTKARFSLCELLLIHE